MPVPQSGDQSQRRMKGRGDIEQDQGQGHNRGQAVSLGLKSQPVRDRRLLNSNSSEEFHPLDEPTATCTQDGTDLLTLLDTAHSTAPPDPDPRPRESPQRVRVDSAWTSEGVASRVGINDVADMSRARAKSAAGDDLTVQTFGEAVAL